MYKLVIFDCDGVLVDSEVISAKVIADVIRPLGIDMTTEEAYKTFVGGSMAATIAYVEERLGGSASIDIESEYRELSFREYRENMKPVDGVTEILEGLKSLKCVASNGPRSKIELNLKITNLDVHFDNKNIFSAYDIQKWKPSPDLYLMAAEQMGVQPSECIVVEDSVNGMRAAQSAGMICLGNSAPLKPLPIDIEGTEVYDNMYEIKTRLYSLGLF